MPPCNVEPAQTTAGSPDIIAADLIETSDTRENMTTIDPSLVAQLSLFAGFNANELGEILRDARSARVTNNNAVFQQGEEAHSFYVLLNGHLRASKTTPTGEQECVMSKPSASRWRSGCSAILRLQRGR
jgi:CRP-like cAMP-binding protein